MRIWRPLTMDRRLIEHHHFTVAAPSSFQRSRSWANAFAAPRNLRSGRDGVSIHFLSFCCIFLLLAGGFLFDLFGFLFAFTYLLLQFPRGPTNYNNYFYNYGKKVALTYLLSFSRLDFRSLKLASRVWALDLVLASPDGSWKQKNVFN